MNSIVHLLFYVITYYLVWFAAIFSAAAGYYWLGFIVASLISAWQWWWLRQQVTARHLGLLVLLFLLAGFVVDSTMSYCGFFIFYANPWQLAPPWIIGLWLNFGIVYYATLKHCFSQFRLLSLLALFGFPLAYVAGARLGAGEFVYGYASSVLIGAIWAILLPLISAFYLKLTGDR